MLAPAMSVFPNTLWTEVHQVITVGGSVRPERMSRLCDRYYSPIHQLFLSRCANPEDAEDMTQEFMAELSQGKLLKSARPEKGSLRNFLYRCIENFYHSHWRKANALKRGGGVPHFSLDERIDAGKDPVLGPDGGGVAAEFDRGWVEAAINRSIESLRKRYRESGQSEVFDLLLEGLQWRAGARSMNELAAAANMRAGTFNTAVHRLNRRFGKTLRAEIRVTVSSESELDQELRYYLSILPG